jgi:DNA-binding CsgD family transcriptional regulator
MNEKKGYYVCQFVLNGMTFFICRECLSSPDDEAQTSLVRYWKSDVAGFIRIDEQRFAVINRGRQTEQEKHAISISLTKRELQIMALAAEGKVNKQIADCLNISQWTVSTHLRRIYAKLGVDRRAAMIYNCAQLIKLYQEHLGSVEEYRGKPLSKTGRNAFSSAPIEDPTR